MALTKKYAVIKITSHGEPIETTTEVLASFDLNDKTAATEYAERAYSELESQGTISLVIGEFNNEGKMRADQYGVVDSWRRK